ncbi:MAG: beta-N-acetylhexosaminidase [Chlamydiae bacterium]|nr:beta-N-acetylhexosaminidase [Chlamydiota bacterium]MBI3266707.1 beta-N-acetylhexosaminidase [Chlamydiota bacterium]
MKKIQPSGLIFFSRNIVSLEQFRSFLSDLREGVGEEVFFALDHEGGWVERFSHESEKGLSLTSFPGNTALGKAGRLDWAHDQGRTMAAQLKALGVQVNFAPVLDVLCDRSDNSGIGIRSFGKDPDLVANLGEAMIRGLQENGIAATAKHFPGHGPCRIDPHDQLPYVRASQRELEEIHLRPFRKAVDADVTFVMTSHGVFSEWDELPTTFSSHIVQGILRKELSFQNIILSDDLEMGAMTKRFSFQEMVLRPLQAGHDFILICHDANRIREAHQILEKAYDEKLFQFENLEKSILRLKEVMKSFSGKEVRTLENPKGLASQIAKGSVELVQRGKVAGRERAIVFIPDFHRLSERYFFEARLLDSSSFFEMCFSDFGQTLEKIVLNLERGLPDSFFSKWSSQDPAVFFCFDAHGSSSEKKVLQDFQKHFKKGAVILLKNPLDLKYVAKEVPCIQTYGFRCCQIKQAIEVLNTAMKMSP